MQTALEEQAVRMAQAELRRPRRENVVHLLAAHTLEEEGGEPRIVGVRSRPGWGGHMEVTVAVQPQGQPYRLAFKFVAHGETLQLLGLSPEAGVRVGLSVYSRHLKTGEITARLGLQPTSAHDSEEVSEWRFFPERSLADSAPPTLLTRLLDDLQDAAPHLQALAAQAEVDVTLSLASVRDEPLWINIEPADLRRLADLGATLIVEGETYGPLVPLRD